MPVPPSFDRKRARSLLAAGMTMRETARDCGATYTAIRMWVLKYRIPYKRADKKPQTRAICNHIPKWRFMDLWRRGYSTGVIGYLYDVSGDDMYNHAIRRGWIQHGEGRRPITMSKIPKAYLKELKAQIRG